MDLAFDYNGQMAIIETLAAWQQRQFVPLVKAGSNSRISLPLYAGDGVVIKVSPSRYEPRSHLPYALPHFKNVEIQGQHANYWLTAYPMVDVSSVEADDVKKLKNIMAESGCCFQPQDDRVDNIGKLPDGNLCVIDRGAIQPVRSGAVSLAQTNDWLDRVSTLYGRSLNDGELAPQSEDTNFQLSPMKQKIIVLEPKVFSNIMPTHRPSRLLSVKRSLGWA
jgi:hypothetical protein